jgi:HD superfamily phosphodiesterase
MPEQVLLNMVRYFGKDVRRISHALKVYGFSKAILAGEGITGETKTITDLAAILHDIGIKEAEWKYNSSAGHYQEIEGPPIARRILTECGITGDVADRVCYLVGHHHTYNKIDGIDFQILVEADFLVNIHEGFIKPDAAPAVVENYFKTKTGKHLADSMYSLKQK